MKAQSEESVPSDHLPAQAGKVSLRPVGGTPARPRLPYQPGIDGLRAVAVTAVLLYHAGVLWMPGGFLGVEVFFVISGYLITSLLLAEWEREGWIDLKAFWLRRARRLLPGLFFLMAATLAFAVLFLPEEVASLRSDAASAVTYVTNWYLIFAQKPYFETVGRPSLLRHLWSLAIEEQFYLLWPVLLSLAVGRWRGQRLLPVILTGAAASALLASILYQPDLDPSRVYYGTDTRASGLLIGAALALAIKPFPEEDRVRKVAAPWLEIGGLAALAALAGLCLWVSEFQPFLYRGALPAVGICTAILIGVIVHPRTWLVPRLLGGRFLVWMGRRSYGIYLWHWPVFMVTRPQLDVPLTGLALLALRLVLTMLLAELSYRVVEDPIRAGALERAWVSLSEARGARRWRFAVEWAISVAVLLLFCISLSVPLVRAQPPKPPSYLPVDSINTISSASGYRGIAATAIPTALAASAPEPALDPSPSVLPALAPSLTSMLPASGPSVATVSPVVLPRASIVILSQSRTQPTPTPLATVTPTDHENQQDSTVAVRQSPVSPSAGSTRGQGALNDLEQPLQSSTPNALPTMVPSPSATVHPAVLYATQLPERQAATLAEAARSGQNQSNAPPTPELPPTPTPTTVSAGRVTAIGDSVMLSAASELERTIPEVEIDTEVGRQVADVIPILQKYHDAGRLGDIVLVHLGNNGSFRPKQIDQIMGILGSERRVIFVNNKVPRSWENYNNRVLSEGVQQYANSVLIDWHSVSVSQPELFWADGYHMRPEGARIYVDLMAAQIREP